MCGRFVQLPLFDKTQAPWPELADDLAGVTAKYNLAPTHRAGLPLNQPWVKDLKGGYSTINARIETVGTKPAYRAA